MLESSSVTKSPKSHFGGKGALGLRTSTQLLAGKGLDMHVNFKP
jgi:hypothetical protein